MRPLSQGEVAEVRENFADKLVQDPALLVDPGSSKTSRDEYIARVVAGGLPMVLRRARPAERARWFDDYVGLVIERDALALTKVRQRRQLPRLLRQLAGQTGQVLNIAKTAASIDMDKSSAENYTKLLEAVFLLEQLPAWGTTLGSRVGAAPKVHVVDSGLAARLLRLTETKLAAARRLRAHRVRTPARDVRRGRCVQTARLAGGGGDSRTLEDTRRRRS